MSVIPLEFEARCGEAVIRGRVRREGGWSLRCDSPGWSTDAGVGWAATYAEAVDAAEKLARIVDHAIEVTKASQAAIDEVWGGVAEVTAEMRSHRPADDAT